MNDWGFFKDFTAFTKFVTETLMDLLSKLNTVLSFLLGKETALLKENADLKDKLATALGNDAADAATIASARAEADAAKAEVTRLTGLVADDIAQEVTLETALQPILDRIAAETPAPEPNPEPIPVMPEPTPEPTPEA
jgi:regulator of replication initiation timing